MIAVGTRVLFTDLISNVAEPHSGQAGTVTNHDGSINHVRFADGQIAWCDPAELTAL